jgi:hypothetical protein
MVSGSGPLCSTRSARSAGAQPDPPTRLTIKAKANTIADPAEHREAPEGDNAAPEDGSGQQKAPVW